jgi:prevent-host-death family protein
MKSGWALQDAKNRFSEVVEKAQTEGPQWVTRRGKESAVVMSIADYRALTETRGDLVDFFRKSPLAAADLDLRRDRDPGREVLL